MNKNETISEIKLTFMGILILLGFIFVLGNQELVFNSVILGIRLVGGFLIPSLFFQITICNLLFSLGFFRKIIGTKAEILVLSFLGGFSVPSLLSEKAYSEKIISRNDAKAFGYSILCGGPALIIGGIGQKMLGSIQIGVILYLSTVFSQLLMFFLQKKSKINNIEIQKQEEIPETIVNSVKMSVTAIINLSGFVIFFSGIANIISSFSSSEMFIFGIEIKDFLGYFLESTFSIHNLILNKNAYSVYLISFFITFGGLCLQMQILSNLKTVKLNFLKLFLIKLTEGLISTIITFVLLKLFPGAVETFGQNNSVSVVYSNIPASIFLIAFSIYILTSPEKFSRKTFH